MATGDFRELTLLGLTGTDLGGDILQIAGMGALMFDTELTGTAASIDFSSIPVTRKSLLLICKARTDRAANTTDAVGVRLNGDSGGNYYQNGPRAIGTTVSAIEGLGAASVLAFQCPAATATASRAGGAVIWIPDYLDTTFHKALFAPFTFSVGTTAGLQQTGIYGGTWANTAAINQVTLISQNGANFIAGTRISVYGIA